MPLLNEHKNPWATGGKVKNSVAPGPENVDLKLKKYKIGLLFSLRLSFTKRNMVHDFLL